MSEANQTTLLSKDTPLGTLKIAFLLCLVCSVLVSGAAVLLKPLQDRNKLLDLKRYILQAAEVEGLRKMNADEVEKVFGEKVVPQLVNLETGELVDGIDPLKYDAVYEAKNPQTAVAIPTELDKTGIKTRSPNSVVYLVRGSVENSYEKVILPTATKGLWSTMYALISLSTSDFNTIESVVFTSHGETPGLGAEVENPNWMKQWKGKKMYLDPTSPNPEVKAGLTKGAAGPDDPHRVDGLSGATITGNGVTALFQYWFSTHGFGVYLAKLKESISATNGDIHE